MLDLAPTKEALRNQLEEAKEEARKYKISDLKSGEWFPSLIRQALRSYADKVDAAYFEEKYPGLNRDAIADRRVDLAQRYASLAGGMSASAYSAAVVMTLGTKGGASPITLPAALVAFTADLLFISRLQLQLAYDLSVLYGQPIDPDDPEDLLSLVKVAFGVKAGQELQNAATKLAPEAVRVGVKKVAAGSALQTLRALPVVGRYLLQRNIIKMAIPGVAVPLSAGLNYFTTGRIARVARGIFRTRAAIDEAAPHLATGVEEDQRLFLEVVWLVLGADRKTSAEEAWLLNALAGELALGDGGDEAVAGFRELVELNEDEVLARLSAAPEDFKVRAYQAACVAAAVDGDFDRKEKRVLERLAKTCGVDYDPKIVAALVETYRP
jgi:uncharacterized protein (DUF697 family)